MLVTIMSDASYCHRSGASGWGVWAKSGRGSFYAGGNFKSKPKSPLEAEAMAISVAVFAAFRQGIAKENDKLIIQSDCLIMVDHYTGKCGQQNKIAKETAKYTKQLIKKNKCTIDVRHVKGHTPGTAPRNYINEVCDQKAKIAMRRQRAEFQKAQK